MATVLRATIKLCYRALALNTCVVSTPFIQGISSKCLAHRALPAACYISRFFATETDKSKQSEAAEDLAAEGEEAEEEEQGVYDIITKHGKGRLRPRDIDVDTSIAYMKSEAFRTTYRDRPVWYAYRRNTKGPYGRRRTRKTCIRSGKIATGNPCPVCRDDHLVVHRKNTELLKQFIEPSTGEIRSYVQTNVCQMQQKRLQVALMEAYDYGDIPMSMPFRTYDYSRYYKDYRNMPGAEKFYDSELEDAMDTASQEKEIDSEHEPSPAL